VAVSSGILELKPLVLELSLKKQQNRKSVAV